MKTKHNFQLISSIFLTDEKLSTKKNPDKSGFLKI